MLISSRVLQRWQQFARRSQLGHDRSKRVLIQGMNYAPEFIGVGKYTTELAQFLERQGHDVEVVTALPHYPGWQVRASHARRYATGTEEGVRVTRCPLVARPGGRVWRAVAPLSFAVAAAPVLLWRCLRSRPETVLCVEPTLFAAPAALLGAWIVGARTVLHVQDLEIDAAFATGYLGSRTLGRVMRVFERLLLRRFDEIVTISDAMASRLRARGVAPARLRVLRNWIGPKAAASPAVASQVRARLGVPDEACLVLYAGNLGIKQGLPVLIEAARHLRCAAAIRFVVVGDGPVRPALRAAAASLPNLDVHDLLPPAEFAGLLQAADLHILPQDRAAADLVFPSKLGPILASGRPLVATADPGSELGCWLGTAAILSPPGDGKALAAAVAAVVGGRALWDPAQAAHLATKLEAAAILPAFAWCLLGPPSTPRSVSTPLLAGELPGVAYLPTS